MAINHGPHKSALELGTTAHFEEEIRDKVTKGQACVVRWDNIKHNHPCQLKVLPMATIPHKSGAYRSILDLLFLHCFKDGGVIDLVNDTAVKWAPRGGIDQLGHSLKRIIHTFAEMDNNTVIIMVKWDIQDGFWLLVAKLLQGRRMEFLLHMAASTRQTAPPHSSELATNGMGGVCALLLCSI